MNMDDDDDSSKSGRLFPGKILYILPYASHTSDNENAKV